jgi:putative transposase
MLYDSEIHHRRSIRLRGHDYSQPGNYYVTICTQAKKHLFGHVVEGEMRRNELGDYAARCWEWLAQQYPYVDLDEWIVMPNHLHGIIVITDGGGGSRSAIGPNGKGGGASRSVSIRRNPLGRLVGTFKTVSTYRINKRHGTPARLLWQRDFYDHIIRDGRSQPAVAGPDAGSAVLGCARCAHNRYLLSTRERVESNITAKAIVE